MAVETIRTRAGRADVPVPVVRHYPTVAMSVGLLLMRIPLGAYFIMAGVSKFRMEGGLDRFVSTTLPDATRFMSESMGRTYLSSLPWVEIGLGSLLIAGLLTRVWAFLMGVLLVSFLMAYGVMTTGTPFNPNLIYAGLAFGLAFTGAGLFSVDGLLFGPRRRVRVTEEYVEPLGG